MQIHTTRFGMLEASSDDVLTFPAGLPGLEDCRRWVLLADRDDQRLAWLQSLNRPDVALAVVNPRRFVPDYQLRLSRGDLAPLGLDGVEDAVVLAVVGGQYDAAGRFAATLNLKAPLVVNPRRRTGRQVVCYGDSPLRYVLPSLSVDNPQHRPRRMAA